LTGPDWAACIRLVRMKESIESKISSTSNRHQAKTRPYLVGDEVGRFDGALVGLRDGVLSLW
jgi:hypothetical protein